MPTKSKRKCQLEGVRAAKKQKAGSTHGVVNSAEEVSTFSDYESEEDATYEPKNNQIDEEQYKLAIIFPRLQNNNPLELDTVSIENIKAIKAQNYMFGYIEGFVTGSELEKQIKKYKNNINLTRESVWTTDVTILILLPI